MIRSALFSFAILLFPVSALASDAILNPTGLPIPRFVSLKSNEINVRVGPGTRYPIAWVFQKKGYPVEIIEEFGHWRKIRDHEDSEGWVHRNLLSGKRTAVTLANNITLHYASDETAPLIATLGTMLVLPIKQCAAHWCEVSTKERKGWIAKQHVWGVYEGELISD